MNERDTKYHIFDRCTEVSDLLRLLVFAKHRLRSGWLLWAAALIVFVGGGVVQAAQPLKIVTTTTIVQDFIRQVAGDRAEVWSLLRPGMDPHAHQAVPADLVALTQADGIFVHGAGLDAWADRMVAGRKAPVFVVTEGIDAPHDTHAHDGHAHDDHAHDGHAHDGHSHYGHSHDGHSHGGDPHFWYDPNLVRHYIERIEAALVALDPEGSSVYRANAAAYLEELESLDRWIRARVNEIPVERRKLVTNHDSFSYFARQYGFEVIGSVIPGFNPEAEPSARQLAQLVRAVQELGVAAIFTETTFNPRLAEAVARDAGGGVRVVSLYTDSLSGSDGPASTYLDYMRFNVNSIVDALK